MTTFSDLQGQEVAGVTWGGNAVSLQWITSSIVALEALVWGVAKTTSTSTSPGASTC